jgi:hypothetical protein
VFPVRYELNIYLYVLFRINRRRKISSQINAPVAFARSGMILHTDRMQGPNANMDVLPSPGTKPRPLRHQFITAIYSFMDLLPFRCK